MSRRHVGHGFTLVEVLVAVIILLSGVVLALRIFPRGFDAFVESQQVQTSNKLLEDMARDFKEHPDTLPDGIYPVESDTGDAHAAAGYFDFADLHAIDYQAATANATFAWYHRHLAPMVLTRVAGDSNGVLVTVDSTTLLRNNMVVTLWSRGAPATAQIQTVDSATQITLTAALSVKAGDALAVRRWPLWQPASLRALRHIVGEKVTIPADISMQELCQVTVTLGVPGTSITVSDSALLKQGMWVYIENPTLPSVVVQVASNPVVADTFVITQPVLVEAGAKVKYAVNFIPGYLPRFGPVQLTGPGDISIYDLRYRRVSQDALDTLQDKLTELPNTFYYAIDYAKSKLYFLPAAEDRAIRLSFYYLDAAQQMQYYVSTPPITIPANTVTPFLIPGIPAGGALVHGSEQINRAYVNKAYDPTGDPYHLNTGEFYYDTTNPYMLTEVSFAPADRGRKVKMDYTAADWGILHEDLTVDAGGVIGLGLPDPKIANRPSYPREPTTWALYGQMHNDGTDTVMALVDVQSGMRYEIVARTGDRTQPYYVEAQNSMAVPNQVIAVDMRDALHGRIKLGGVPPALNWCGNWRTGTSYQTGDGVLYNYVPYRCIQDHVASNLTRPEDGPQAATHWDTAAPDWDVLHGITFRAYYRTRRDWSLQVYKAPSVFRYRTKAAGDTYFNTRLDWNSFTGDLSNTDDEERRRIYVPAVYAGQTVAVDYFYRDATDPADSRLLKITGEQHVVPTRQSGNQNCAIPLAHVVAQSTPVTVRGASVTLRATWIQPRGGMAYTFDTATNFNKLQESERSLSERWQSRTFTIALPATKN